MSGNNSHIFIRKQDVFVLTSYSNYPCRLLESIVCSILIPKNEEYSYVLFINWYLLYIYANDNFHEIF